MKYKLTLKCNINKLFDSFIQPTINGYYLVHEKTPTDAQLAKGITYKTTVNNKKKNPRTAVIKVLKYSRPTLFKMEYRSDSYHKIDYIELKEIDADTTEVVYEKYEEFISSGVAYKKKGSVDSKEIGKPSFFEAWKFKRAAAQARNR